MKILFISNLKKPSCAPKQDVLELMTLWHVILFQCRADDPTTPLTIIKRLNEAK